MRYVTKLLRPSRGWFHEIGRRLFQDSRIRPITLHHIDVLADGTVIGLYEVNGNANHVRDRFAEIEPIHECHCTDIGESVMLYDHYDSNDQLRQVLTPLRWFEIVLDTPMKFTL